MKSIIRFENLESLTKTLKKDLQVEVLLYTFVNHHATYSNILNDVSVATNTKNKNTVRSALNSLINKNYIEKTNNELGYPIYINKLLVDDVKNLSTYNSVKYYMEKHGRKEISETDLEPKTNEEILKTIWVARGFLIALMRIYADDPKISEQLGNTLKLIRNTIKPDLEKRGKIEKIKKGG